MFPSYPPSSEKAEAAKRGTPTLARTGTLSLTTPNLTLAKRRTPTLTLARTRTLTLTTPNTLALTRTLTLTLTLTLSLTLTLALTLNPHRRRT